MMGNNPYILLFGLGFALFIGGKSWRRRKLKRAVRDLPTRMQRALGDEPNYDPPEDLPDGLESYAALHRRSELVMYGVWAVAFLWLAYALVLVVRKQVL